MANKPLEYYIDRYQRGLITREEATVLRELLQEPGNRQALETIMSEQLQQWEESAIAFPDVEERVQAAVQKLVNQEPPVAPVHRIHFLKTAWFRYAAAVLIVLITGAVVWTTIKKEITAVATGEPASGNMDIMPRRGAALLTLADGRTIELDSAANGNLASQGGVRIVKTDDGQLEYVVNGLPAGEQGEVLYNTISTPPGTQYRLTLADGTRVWLNVASSITYPTAFTGKERNIKVTGEAYFEVAKNKDKPFLAEVDGKFSIQVLGTSFNMNAYTNEQSYNTTLLEGKVQILSNQDARAVTLQPGEQAQVGRQGQIAVVKNVDQEKVMAWKNGLFNFNNARLEEVMREIARWYDIEVVYEKDVPNIEFVGKISRDLSLSQVLNGLKGTGFHFRIEEGRKLIITP